MRATEVRKEYTVRATEVRKENTVQATEGMEKIAMTATIKKIATRYCDGEEAGDGCMKLVAVMCL